MSTEPTLADVIASAIESKLLDVHTALPGRVVSYDAAKQTADIEIVTRRAQFDSRDRIALEDFPVIPNVPVGWLSGGGYGLQFPMAKGDGVWLVFSESAWDQWRLQEQIGAPGDMARHDLSYPIAMPVLRSDKAPLPNPSGGALVTVPGGGKLSVSTDGGTAQAIPRDDKLQAELTRIKSDLTTIKTQLLAVCTQADIGAVFAGSPAQITNVTSALGAVPSDPGTTASSTLKAE